jgi:hypothetical protein
VDLSSLSSSASAGNGQVTQTIELLCGEAVTLGASGAFDAAVPRTTLDQSLDPFLARTKYW